MSVGGERVSWARGAGGRRGLEAAGYSEDVFRVGFDVALVGAGLPALQEVDILSGMPTCFAHVVASQRKGWPE